MGDFFYFFSAMLYNMKGLQRIFSEVSSQVVSSCPLLRELVLKKCLMCALTCSRDVREADFTFGIRLWAHSRCNKHIYSNKDNVSFYSSVYSHLSEDWPEVSLLFKSQHFPTIVILNWVVKLPLRDMTVKVMNFHSPCSERSFRCRGLHNLPGLTGL